MTDAMPRNDALDLLKLVLAVLVTLFHAHALADLSPLLADLADRGFGRIVVPTFLLINGFFFQPALARGEPRPWLMRLGWVYLGSMLLYLPFWAAALPGWPRLVPVLASRWLLGFGHLWYLAGLLGAALLLTALRHWPARRLLALALAAYLLGALLQYLGAYQVVEQPLLARVLNSFHAHRNFALLSFPYLWLGYVIRAQRWHERVSARCVALMLGAGLVALTLEALVNIRHAPLGTSFDNLFTGALAAAAVLLAVLRVRVRVPLPQMSGLAIGIYLLHPMAIALLHSVTGLSGLPVGLGAVVLSALTTSLLLWLLRLRRAGASLAASALSR